jgi:hypothetical protein
MTNYACWMDRSVVRADPVYTSPTRLHRGIPRMF